MDPDHILKKVSYFLSLSMSKSNKLILSDIEKLDSFSAKEKAARKNFKYLSAGSSRLVLLTDEGSVIKMAKNKKGISQNRAEANPKMKSVHINKVLSKANNFSWIEVNYLEKITSEKFNEITGLNFKDFSAAIGYALQDVSEESIKKPSDFKKIESNGFFQEIVRLGKKFDLMPGDIARISSWGEKDGIPILIDAGLTKNVYEKYYE